jgi:hypothetical protein
MYKHGAELEKFRAFKIAEILFGSGRDGGQK